MLIAQEKIPFPLLGMCAFEIYLLVWVKDEKTVLVRMSVLGEVEEIEYDKLHSSEIEAKIIHDFAVELGELFVKHGGIRRLIALWQFLNRWGDQLDAFYETHEERYLIQ